jgi:hypothetical protein
VRACEPTSMRGSASCECGLLCVDPQNTQLRTLRSRMARGSAARGAVGCVLCGAIQKFAHIMMAYWRVIESLQPVSCAGQTPSCVLGVVPAG